MLPAPTVPRPRPAPQGMWWSGTTETAISRNALLRLWYVEVARGVEVTDPKTFVRELQAWSGNLARVDWVVDGFAPAVPELLRRATEPRDDVDGWCEVSAVVAAYVDPLSRYTSGWARSVASLRPTVPASVGHAIREMGRRAVVPIRRELTDSDMIVTRSGVDDFVQNQRSRHQTHSRIALHEYRSRLQKYLTGLRLKNDPDDGNLRTVLAEHYLDLAEKLRSAGGVPDRTKVAVADLARPDTAPHRTKSRVIATRRTASSGTRAAMVVSDGDLEHHLARTQLCEFARIWISRDPTQRLDDESLCWEAALAMDGLADPQVFSDGVAAAVSARWTKPPPSRARTLQLASAIRYVELLVKAAQNAARKIGEA
ncbi:hypothetical protein GIY30_02220 [Gordonia sp. HNM0687]|uniref:Uncharacterized protein n=1 Tax=Gordonia mangrovi TaxID=2665643 RepID=A0A6L7GJW9_9ACTN|nr:hypothetical protein [Gordonia mangrovi]MXP20186.1 hypothetical protein [Gordonia mangrovi]UVF79207.1 hypothetical protein NWF22_05020 [Gordonia mangrovi]